CMQDIQLPLAF
nr:immunoglobulin light chain junction region [Macaca mulatta]